MFPCNELLDPFRIAFDAPVDPAENTGFWPDVNVPAMHAPDKDLFTICSPDEIFAWMVVDEAWQR
jgi:hypothetical protein